MQRFVCLTIACMFGQVKLSSDVSDFATFMAELDGRKSKQHLTKVYHVHQQNSVGSAVVNAFMAKQCSFHTVDFDKVQGVVDAARSCMHAQTHI